MSKKIPKSKSIFFQINLAFLYVPLSRSMTLNYQLTTTTH